MKLDHLFVGTSDIERSLAVLCEAGLVPGSSNTHPGQGTANRRFFFRNLMLELLYIVDPVEAVAPVNQLLRLPERCRDDRTLDSRAQTAAISPFGICFRPSDGASPSPTFPVTRYQPAYLPTELHINIGKENAPQDPLWFHLPFSSDAGYETTVRSEPLDHPLGVRQVTRVTLDIVGSALSATAELCRDVPALSLHCSSDPLLTLEFDEGARRRKRDFRPLLPLVMCW